MPAQTRGLLFKMRHQTDLIGDRPLRNKSPETAPLPRRILHKKNIVLKRLNFLPVAHHAAITGVSLPLLRRQITQLQGIEAKKGLFKFRPFIFNDLPAKARLVDAFGHHGQVAVVRQINKFFLRRNIRHELRQGQLPALARLGPSQDSGKIFSHGDA